MRSGSIDGKDYLQWKNVAEDRKSEDAALGLYKRICHQLLPTLNDDGGPVNEFVSANSHQSY